MEGGIRSGGGVLKKKTSSGCLIIKKKVETKNSGSAVNYQENKRARLVGSDSDASDEDESLEFMRRKVNDKRLHHNGSVGYKRSEFENREHFGNNVGVEIGRERKRSRADLFEFDEYDEFDRENIRNGYVEDRFKMVARSSGGGNSKEFGVGSSGRNVMVDKRKQSSYLDGPSFGRGKGLEYGGLRNQRLDMEEDEARMPNSSLRFKFQETTNEPIRLQGKNGVLKVMVNKKKKMDIPPQYKNREVEERENIINKDFSARMPVIPASRIRRENRGLFIDEEKIVKEEVGVKLEKMKSNISKGIKARDLESGGSDMAHKPAPPGLQVCSSKKAVIKDEKKTPPQNSSIAQRSGDKGKEVNEVKAKRGGSTEKQMLREKIRGMLIDAGWTIDYRPRRNRDYLDAVYINPNGTAYWSIIKAYDAFKKDTKTKSDVGSPSFAPLSEDLINKLTRQTKKKIEQEMRRKRKEDGLIKSAKKQSEVDEESEDDLSDDSPKRKPKKVKVEKPFSGSNSNMLQGRTSKVIGRCTLLVRGKGENSESDGYVPYSGKRTVLSWLIDSGTAQLSEKVQYMNRRRTRAMLEGWITRDGVHCGCCSKILTVSKFELHAGSQLRQPFQNIFLESGVSLLQCQVDAWNKQKESVRSDFHTVDVDGEDPDDDTCGICGDGGALICCDSCPSTFHQICLGIQKLPSGDWHCPNCICKFCGDASRNVDEENGGTADELMRCTFCEKKYHKSCSEEMQALPTSPNVTSFCELKCQELYDRLQKILGVKHELEGGFSWSLIQRADVSDASQRGYSQRVECNSKLAVSLSVMDECFLPIIDRRSGINMIHNVVYNRGSNFNRLNYRGFYTAVLERGDEIVSAASIRIHGTRLAEMPFIGTRDIYRRQGMCRRLLSAIETELCSLKVEQLIIPAIAEHMNTWTTVFGFHRLDDVLKKEIKSMNMLVFPGTDMLQKPLIKQEISDGMKVPESVKDQPQLPPVIDKSDIDSSMEPNKPAVLSNDSKSTSASDSASESDTPLASNETTMIELEAESKQNELSTKTNKISDMENQLLDLPMKDNINSSEEQALAKACNNNANGEHVESSPKKDVNDEPLVQLKPSPNKPTNENVKENQIPAPLLTFPDTGENNVTGGVDDVKTGGISEMLIEGGEKVENVVSPDLSSENLAKDTKTTEDNTE